MRSLVWSRSLLLCALALSAAAAVPRTSESSLLLPRDGHHHSHHGVVLTELNETQILRDHGPTLPSYWSIDFEDPDGDTKRFPALMGLHVVFMSLAFFVALPIGISLRAVKHSCHALSVVAFYVLTTLGMSFSALYKKLTPDMYENSAHRSHGYVVLAAACLLTSSDLLSLVLRIVSYIRAARSGSLSYSFSSFCYVAVLGKDDSYLMSGPNMEYVGLVGAEDPEEFEEQELKVASTPHLDHAIEQARVRPSRPVVSHIKTVSFDREDEDSVEWAQSAASNRTLFNTRHDSDDTLHDLSAHIKEQKPWYRLVGIATFATLERVLVFAGFMQLLTGIATYTGGCRASYTNICLAHLIKGGIFWCYGLLTFGRYLGAFSEWGWAWNYVPSLRHRNVPTAEFVECFVIFLYGASNTWMERLGVNARDAYTTRQIQHISIAVMYWLAGMTGMALESKTFRRWLAAGAVATKSSTTQARGVVEPPSYIGSFNPFPALCIGITGVALSAHFQQYLFQVQIHALWGYLLSAFAVFRCMTYFFLWLSPPRSLLPSRPPTEAVASFFLTCGGLVFMFSSEEVTIAAMRQGRDDVMMFLNLSVAITCFAFCWAITLVAFKGWLKSRTIPVLKLHSLA